ncbi:phosphoinositide phosphatase SAC8 isoform X12 [Aegilops tauschii subsp. strangulata]|uniref:SAC domain-containing protein n=2 Tax=Aegilops tauschii subsp. strangulata TaxID=200361 RepID=A0A453IB59_AEGTS|nr:phosphoinositide phosphatase SAC8 isoform X9 [Aegilops tauschii subsp. strangulata]
MATDADEAPLLADEPLRPGSCSRELELREFRDRYVFRSLDGGGAFAVARADGSLHPLSPEEAAAGSDCKVSKIYGVAGMIRLLAGSYVLVITSRKDAGSYGASTVYHANSMKFLCCNEAIKHLTSEEKRDEAYFMSLLRIAETTCGLYYSYDRDLTLNLQRASKLAAGRVHKPLWKQADPRFVWNRNLLEELIETKLDEFITPLIQGSFQTEQFTLKDRLVRITLFSRRCNRRLGTRMWRRGANLEGATANFVETEQLVEYEGLTSSFIQVRGSIPLLWEQIVDLSYKPRPSIIEHEEMTKVVERHFHDLSQRYGDTMVIDLTDKQGDEGNLSNAFAAEMQNFPDIRYVHFDFHHICGGGNFDNLQVLYDEIEEAIQKQGYFLMNSKGEILLDQSGVVRSNCIDCLDRTNVTQSFLARKSLDSQLQRMGALSSAESISQSDIINDKFKKLWVEHGDELSLEYAGSYALKGDLVRYGRQTLPGLIKDGMSALSRYYLNNFHDGVRQDALDLISGYYTVSKSSSSPFQIIGFESAPYLPVASAIIVGGITVTTFTLSQVGRSAQHLISSIIFAGLTAGVVALVKANGKQLCSRPRLCGLI